MKEILSKRLIECRKAKGYTQQQASIYSDVTERSYQNYELMRREPKIEILIRIADMYGVSVDYLVGRTDNRKIND